MTTEVILTGTGVPHVSPGRAGPGVLVRYRDTVLQFDAGRATTLRLAEAAVRPTDLTAVFLTHVHSDHVTGLADLILTDWLEGRMRGATTLQVISPTGDATRFVRQVLAAYEGDIVLRSEHLGHGPPQLVSDCFEAADEPRRVWQSPKDDVEVDAVLVHHEPVRGAVAYRVRTPDGTVVISGDTRVCREMESVAAGCQVLVHEAARTTALRELIRGTDLEAIFAYHADTALLGAMAERAGVRHLVLTHLIPQPTTTEEAAAFEYDIRESGFRGAVTVGSDLDYVSFDG